MDSLLALLDRLEAVVMRGAGVPLSEKRMVDVPEVLGLLRMIRSHLPADLHRAQRLNEDAEALHRRATDEARRIIMQAETHARRLVDESPMVTEAERQKGQVLREAEEEAARIRRGAEEYASRVLADLEAQVSRILGAIQRGKTMLETSER